MSYKMLFVVNAVVAVVVGLLLFVAPALGLAQFAMSVRVQELFMARVVGALLVSLGLFLWFAKDTDDATQKNLGMAALAASVLGLIASVIGYAAGVVNGLGWLGLVIAVLFSLGYAFMLFLKPKMKE